MLVTSYVVLDLETQNECLLGTHNSHEIAICTDTVLSFTCSCKEGFTGNGFNTDGMNEDVAKTIGCTKTTDNTETSLAAFKNVCPSEECWNYEENTHSCQLIASCVEDQCSAVGMTISFQKNLFGEKMSQRKRA